MLSKPMINERRRIGDILLDAGLISADQLESALKNQGGSRERLGRVLVALGYLSEEQVARGLAEQLLIPQVTAEEVIAAAPLFARFPRRLVEERQAFPVVETKNSIRLAMVDPLDFAAMSDVQFHTGKTVQPAVATPSLVNLFLRGGSTKGSEVREALRKIQPTDQIEVLEGGEEEDDHDILTLKQAGEAAPIVSMVNMILSEAAKSNASDVHIEPREKDLLVRFRIDGILRDISTLPSYLHPSVVSRVKIMAKMDISIRRRPQDGSTKIKMGEREIDLRISTLPTLYGEKMVIRILDKSRQLLALEDLGILPGDLNVLRSFLARPQGMLLVTGPTGSGKSTTLYAALLQVRSEGVNIVTVEDPIEYQIPGINQVHVNEKAGITFANGLRSILRQDPNVIMVGEIRDRETAEIAFQAALTGHLVLSTLHTNNAVAAITRLVNIGVEPYLVASSVVGVMAQRLVRRNCPNCLASYQPDPMVLAQLHLDQRIEQVRFYHGTGCEQCNFVGYKGRIGVYEILKVDDVVREFIINRASERKILAQGRSAGMTTMEEDGFFKVIKRVTTAEEILRVIPPEEILRDEGVLKKAKEDPPSAEPKENQMGSLVKVILVEGAENSLVELVELLHQAGCSCVVVREPREVLHLLEKYPSSLVISEILLRDSDIGELEKLLRGTDVFRQVPLLAVSNGGKTIGFLKEIGFDWSKVISRPFDATVIRAKIDLWRSAGKY